MKKQSRILKAIPAKQEVKNAVYEGILRTLFFGKLFEMELDTSKRAELLDDTLRQEQESLINALKSYQDKVCGLMSTQNKSWLTQELTSDKLYDISNLVQVVAEIDNNKCCDLLYTMSIFLRHLMDASKNGILIDFDKYTAMFEVIEMELQQTVKAKELDEKKTLLFPNNFNTHDKDNSFTPHSKQSATVC